MQDSIDESVVPTCDELLDDKTSNDNNSGDKCSLCAGLSTPDSKCSCKSSSHSHPIDQPLDLSIHSRHKLGSINGDSHSKKATQMRDKKCVIKVPKPSQTSKPSQPSTTTPTPTTTKAIKRNRLPTNSTWKRTYTEEELEAALRDIQSGKLGTRRAAVIYGIPRSTLRNKVYKLALEKTNGKRKVSPSAATAIKTTTNSNTLNKKFSKSLLLNHNKSNNKSVNQTNSTLNHMLDDPNNSAMSASESLKQILKNAITQKANTGGSGGAVRAKTNHTNHTEEQTMADMGSGQALQALAGYLPGVGFNSLTDLYNCEALATIQMLSTLECGQALAPLFTQFLLANIHQLALAKRQSQDNCDDMTNAAFTPNIPLLPDLVRKLAEDQIVQTARTNSSQSSPNQSNGESHKELTSGNNNVILKVPSYKPKTTSAAVTSESKQSNEEQPNVNTSDTETINQLCTSSSHTESDERINDEFESKSFSLKDIIAKSISRRLYNSTTSAKFSSNIVNNSEDSSSDALASDDKYDKFDGLSASELMSGNVSDHSNPSTPEKRNRPKRGRYRNYNRDDLAKAVKAVQRGEMSVHRAGTLFGVPHSTLEYKVKERHLLRPKKRLSETNVTVKKESVGKSNGSTNNRVMNGSPNNSAINLMDSSGQMPLWQSAFPLLPLEVNNSGQNSANFFASNMMRKLQENARMNEEVVKSGNDSNGGEYGGLLLDSLIKSSLVNKTVNSKVKSEVKSEDEDNDGDDDDEDDNQEVMNTSLKLLKEVSALEKKD
ncbi:unnamed protein product [Medioppia subpectinata]|uniref:HTH psq-type domain-containing protein n=1 Tax=Medioppia subpectinata TaxID=1979941 RepID=A0A7R9Q5Q5_9ACAR|nr:unnamed protein product [Medioppia subpectinata]CAG2112517.1 unnamed protein product [Medioppia subpectinata]